MNSLGKLPFHWSETHQAAFEQIKELLIKPPILHLPRPGGRFILYCDTSKMHTASCLWPTYLKRRNIRNLATWLAYSFQ